MRQIIHRKQDIIAIARYLLQNYDSKFEFVTEPILCWGNLRKGIGTRFIKTPVWVMRIKFSSGLQADAVYAEAFGRLKFYPWTTAASRDIVKTHSCELLTEANMTLQDEHRTWILGTDDNGDFVQTIFQDFASNKRQASKAFKKQFPGWEPIEIELETLKSDRLIWVIAAQRLESDDGPDFADFCVDLFGHAKPIEMVSLCYSNKPFSKKKEYFLFDRHFGQIGLVNHLIGVKWVKYEGLTPVTLSQLSQPLPELGFDRNDPYQPACRDIWS